ITPYFNIRIIKCSEQFINDFSEKCLKRRLLFSNDFKFYSKTQHLSYIKGNYDLENQVFEICSEKSLLQLYQASICHAFPSAISFARLYRDVF
ncbi:hypothetical protein Mgra_00006359, partial [Meloidogyne graminicola]